MPVGFEVDSHHPAPQPLEQRWHDRAARPTHAVERDGEPPGPNAVDVNQWQPEDCVEVTLDRVPVGGDHTSGTPLRRNASTVGC